MVQFILEQPWGVAAVGGLALLAGLTGWMRSGQKEMLWVSLGLLLLTIILVFIGLQVETENEALRKMLFQTANDLENNRVDAVVAAIYKRPTEQVLESRSLLETKKYLFTAARIKKIHSIEFSGTESERRAVVRMNVFVEGTFFTYQVAVPRYVELTLFRDGGTWKVYDYIQQDAFEGFKAKSA